MPTITVVSSHEQVEPRRIRALLASWLNTDVGSTKSKRSKINPFEADLRKDDDLRWLGAERLVPLEVTFNPPPPPPPPPPPLPVAAAAAAAAAAAVPMDSYRVPPLKMTLETILEDKPPELLYLVRSKSLPTQRRHHNLGTMPTYRPGQDGTHLAAENGADRGEDGGDGTFFAGDGGGFFAGDDRGSTFGAFEGGYGVSMSGPVLSTPGGEYARRYTRRKVPFTKLREAIRRSGLRGAVSQLLSRFRPSSRRSH